MSIIKKYKLFINESADSSNEIKQMSDVPQEVIDISKKIASDIYDKVKKPIFEIEDGIGLVMKFNTTEQDFNYIDSEQPLKLDLGDGARRKRSYDVTLIFIDKISETFEVKYKVDFEMLENDIDEDDIDDIDEDDIDNEIKDDYYNNYDDEFLDDDEIEKDFKINKFDDFDSLDDDDISNEEFNPLKKKDWKDVGDRVRKGIGFLTPEEELEEGKRRVFSHPNRFKVYSNLDSDKAEKYLIFWANHDTNATPVWNENKQDFEDQSRYSSNTGPGGIEPW